MNNEPNIIIYCLKDPRTGIIRYIGKTKNSPKHRLSQHTRECGNNKKCNWIKSLKKVGLKPIIEIIDNVSIENWKECEIGYIKLLKSCGALLVNERDGGDGDNLSKESIQRIIDKQKKKSVYQYDLNGNFINEFISISEASRKTNSNVYHISSVCNGRRGMENKFIWRFKDNVIDKKNINPYRRNTVNRVSVYQYDFNGKFICEWESATLAGRELGIFDSKIINVCKNKSKTAKGFIFRYKKSVSDKKDLEISKVIFGKKINQFTNEGVFIKTWDNIIFASKELSINNRNIGAVCSGDRNSAGGFTWKYFN